MSASMPKLVCRKLPRDREEAAKVIRNLISLKRQGKVFDLVFWTEPDDGTRYADWYQ